MTHRNTIQSVTFTPEDLEYNRRGELSPRQRAAIREENVGCLGLFGAIIGACTLVIVGALVLPDESLRGLAVVAGVVSLAVGFMVRVVLQTEREPVQAARGAYEHVVDRSEVYTYRHNMVIGGTPFRTDHMIPRAFEPGATYAVYYRGSDTKYILSYERLDDDPGA